MRHFFTTVALLSLLGHPGAAPAAEAVGALAVSADGQEIHDPSSGQAWSRCVEGMRWDGKGCQGKPALLSHGEALAAARTRSQAEGRLWRVPRVPELRHLADRLSHAARPATLAPAAPAGWYWTSTARIDSESTNPYAYRNVQRGVTETRADRLVVQAGWAVDMATGDARGDVAKREKLPLRLVRELKN